jgi:TPR repeat protein
MNNFNKVYTKAVQGDTDSQYIIGYIYSQMTNSSFVCPEGFYDHIILNELKKHPSEKEIDNKAYKWLGLAANNGSIKAMETLSEFFYVRKNEIAAKSWEEKALKTPQQLI